MLGAKAKNIVGNTCISQFLGPFIPIEYIGCTATQNCSNRGNIYIYFFSSFSSNIHIGTCEKKLKVNTP